MNKHWQSIIEQINTEFGIQFSDDWLNNKKNNLKKFQSALELKIKSTIVQDLIIAKAFLDEEVIHSYVDLSEEDRSEAIDNYVVSNRILNPKIDLRTLEKALTKQKTPNHRKILNSFSVYVNGMLFEHSYSLVESQSPSNVQRHKEKSNKISQFYDTYWWVYYFHYQDYQRISKLGRAVLSIQGEDKVFLENIDTETSTNYVGNINMENSNQHIHLELTATKTLEKHLRILLYIGVGRVYPLLLGVYTNIHANNSMVAGSIVFERVNDISIIQNMKPQSFLFDEALKIGIDKNIVDFFRERGRNYLKTPAGILTKASLESWKEIQTQRNTSKT